MTFFSTFFSCANGYPMLLGGPFFEGTMRTWTGFSLQWECHVMSLVSCDQAFIEQRKHEKNQGHRVGPMTLFFGGRHAHAEYYYRDEFENFEAEGLVKCCNAWSRDQKQKVYVQHKIMEQADDIWANLGREGSRGYFFLCGSKQPEKDVFAALIKIFEMKGGLKNEEAHKKMESLQLAGRYVTEVY